MLDDYGWMDTAAYELKQLLEQKNELMETFRNSKRSYGEIMDFLKRKEDEHMEKIEQLLCALINEHGIDYLQREPYEVYKKIISSGTDGKLARLVLVTLLSDASIKAREMDLENLSKNIQKECCMKKKAADEMSKMYKSLFDAENMSGWKRRMEYGFREFCSKTWKFQWDGENQWSSGGGHIDCWCTINAEIEVTDKEVAQKIVKELLDNNPFTTAEKIYGYYAKKMSKALDDELEDYVTGEDYYPPVMEDYHHNGEYALEECCGKLGLKVVMFDCDGSMSDFEPDHMRW